MPLEVVDRQGEPLGLIVGRYYGGLGEDSFYVVAHYQEDYALTELFPQRQLEQLAATHLGAKSLMGRVQEDKLYEKLRHWWEVEQGQDPQDYEPYLAMRAVIFVQNAYGPFKLVQKVKANQYFFCASTNLERGRIVLDVGSRELPWPADLPFPALVGKVEGYPEVELDVAGVGETLFLGGSWNDLGGRNHTHSTRIRFRSGDALVPLELPGVIGVRQGEIVALEVDREKANIEVGGGCIFAGGAIYKLA